MSPETRAKMSAAKMGNQNAKGWRRPPESCARIAAKMLGNKNSAGRKDSPETIAKKRAALADPLAEAKRRKALLKAMRNPLTRARLRAVHAAKKGISVLPSRSPDLIGYTPDYNRNRVIFYRPEAV